MGVNLAMAIEGLQFAYREGSRDISYSIQLAEYRQLNVPTVKVAVKTKRPAVKVVSRTYTVRTRRLPVDDRQAVLRQRGQVHQDI